MSRRFEFAFVYIVLLCVLGVWLYRQYQRRELVEQTSSVDGSKYLVRRQTNPSNQLEAANLLARLAAKTESLIAHLKNHYGARDERVNRLVRRFRKSSLSESLSSSKQTSYSVNKGQSIVMCLRSKDTGALTDENTVTFVLLHELGHLMSVSVGHNDEFWKNFRFILKHALYWKIYTYQHFDEKPVPYCGISITDTPLSWTRYQRGLKKNPIDQKS